MRHWPAQSEIEQALNEWPTEMVHELADIAFAKLEHNELVALLASNILRQPRVIRTIVTDNASTRDSV